MKTTNKKKFFLILALFLFLSIYNSACAHAEVSYLGEFCVFESTPGVVGMPPILLMKLGVLFYGDGHFVLNGNGSTVSPDIIAPVYGTGVLDINGNTFVATLVDSSVGATNTSFTVSHLVLNLATDGSPQIGNGTATGMIFDLTQPTAQSQVITVPIYVTKCGT